VTTILSNSIDCDRVDASQCSRMALFCVSLECSCLLSTVIQKVASI